ncbi:MAG: hypothetical protein R3B81_17350 [bacterium]
MSHVIPKREVGIVLHLETGEVLRGTVFLDFIDVIHRGEQTLLDKTNDENVWFPLKQEDGTVEVVNRERVVLVEPGLGVTADLVRKECAAVFREERVTVKLHSDRVLVGRIAMDLPDEFSRVSDFLNFPQNFFALETDDGPVLVSKEHVASLVPHERPPVPGSAADEIGERA